MQHRIPVTSRRVSQLKHFALLFCILWKINEWDLSLIHQLNIWRSLFARYSPSYLRKQHRWKRPISMKLYSIWRIVVLDCSYPAVIVCVYLGVSHLSVLKLSLGWRMKNRLLFSIDWVLLCRHLVLVRLHIDSQKKRIFWLRLLHLSDRLIEMLSNVNSCIDVPDLNKKIGIENVFQKKIGDISVLCKHHWILSNVVRWVSFFPLQTI